MVHSISSTAGRAPGIRFRRPGHFARFAALAIAWLLAAGSAAEPKLPPGPEWRSGSLRRADDGTLQLVPGRRSGPAPPAASASHARPKPELGRGTRAIVTWSPPTTYEDGRPLRGPLGYKVHYGTHFGRYTKTVNAGGQTRLTIEGLEPGNTYYFVVTAYTEEGVESSYSEAVAVRLVEP